MNGFHLSVHADLEALAEDLLLPDVSPTLGQPDRERIIGELCARLMERVEMLPDPRERERALYAAVKHMADHARSIGWTEPR